MTNSKEVTRLRKEGKLEQAYLMAKQGLEETPGDIWMKRAMSWCLYEALKSDSSFGQKEAFLDKLAELRDMDMPANEDLLWKSVLWPIQAFVRSCAQQEQVPNAVLMELSDILKAMPFPRHSKEFSVLMNAALNLKEWNDFSVFCDWWGLENFMPEDYEKQPIPESDEMMMSLAERVCYANAKSLLLNMDAHKENQEMVARFQQHLERIAKSHPDYQFVPYYMAKLHIATGQKKEAKDEMIVFAMKKPHDFWVWETLGDAIDDEEFRFSCYSKAMTCKSPEEMFLNIREKYAMMLVARKQYALAKTEVMKAIETRRKKNFHLTAKLLEMAHSDWFGKTQPNKDNMPFYLANCGKADELLYESFKEEPVMVTQVNEAKRFVSFITTGRKEGFFNYGKLLKKAPKVGDVLLCRFQRMEVGKPSNVLTCKADAAMEHYIGVFFKRFEGPVRIAAAGFGFVGDVFVPAARLGGKTNGDLIEGLAMLKFDKKKGVWGWMEK